MVLLQEIQLWAEGPCLQVPTEGGGELPNGDGGAIFVGARNFQPRARI